MTIQPLPPMPQLKLDTEGKPAIPSWVAPPETKLDDIQWQPLRTLDLALLDGTPEQQKECQETFAAAVKNEGFVLIKNFGVAPAVVSCGSRADCDEFELGHSERHLTRIRDSALGESESVGLLGADAADV